MYEHPHVFCDIEALNPQCYSAADSYRKKKKMILGSFMQTSSPCINCYDTLCSVPAADFGISGLPCTDMSYAGKRLTRDGVTNSVYMTHAKYNKRNRTPLFVVECTPETGLHMFSQNLFT